MIVYGPALLFCPADRPERYEKASERADAVILDFEDAVAAADKPKARLALRNHPLDPARTIVRVNPGGTEDHEQDLRAVRDAGYRMVMLAKSEDVEHLDSLHGLGVIALIETALGVENLGEIARHPSVTGLMWGAEDLIASTQGRSSRFDNGTYRDVARFARARTLIAARAAGKAAIDAVHIDIADTDGLKAEAEDAAASGFSATACIHPSQVNVIRSAYAPTEAQRAWASRVTDEAGRQPGVFRFEGQMIDEPVLRQARKLLE